MSRSWPRVASPSPAFSTLMTSAPNQASSCVQVGPDCTWVKSRMRTPSNALLMSLELLMMRMGCGSLVHGLRHRAGRVDLGIDPDVDHRRPAGLLHRLAGALQGAGDLRRVAHFLAVAAEHLGELAVGNVAEQVADVAALGDVLGDL